MSYQKPKSDHPWRQYSNRKTKNEVQDEPNQIHIREFISELSDNWEEYEITTVTSYEGNNRHKLSTMPQDKIAAWISGMLKRNYVKRE